MNKVKNWSFPSFEDWESNGCKWYGALGDYNCAIEQLAWSGEYTLTTFECAISVDGVPTNIFVTKNIMHSKVIDVSDNNVLKDWYNQTTKLVEKEWEEFISKTYFDN